MYYYVKTLQLFFALLTSLEITNYIKMLLLQWLGSVTLECRTYDREVMGSTRGRVAIK